MRITVNCPSMHIPYRTPSDLSSLVIANVLGRDTQLIKDRKSFSLYPNRNVTRKLEQFPLTCYRKFTNLSHTEYRSVLNIARDCKGNDYESDSRVEPLNVLMHILIRNHTRPQKKSYVSRTFSYVCATSR